MIPWAKIWENFFKGGDSFMLRGSNKNSKEERLRRMHEAIAKKAYELSEKKNHQSGNDLQNWLEAERMVKRSLRLR